MTLLETIAVAFSMYSAIPVPQFEWNGRNMKYAMCAFPLIGLVVGGAEWAVFHFSVLLGFPELLRGCILCLLPVLITGGIHLDGYCDTCDALASHSGPEKKQEILKDPHIGSFAAIRLGSYFLFSLALWTALPEASLPAVLLCFCVSRCLSGLSVCTFPLARDTGLAHAFAAAADKKRAAVVLCALLVLSACGVLLLGGVRGGAALAAALIVFGHYYLTAMRQFGGLSGDLAGWFLQKCELWMIAAVLMTEYLEGLL